MTKLCARGKSAAKRKFKVYPSAYANAYASKICAGKIKDPSGTKRKDWGPKKMNKGGGADMSKVKTKKKNILDKVTDKLNKAGEAYKKLGEAGLNVLRGNTKGQPFPAKKMVGGMAKKYSVGGGADMGDPKKPTAVPRRRNFVGQKLDKARRYAGTPGYLPKPAIGKMGGGMMNKPMGYKDGTKPGAGPLGGAGPRGLGALGAAGRRKGKEDSSVTLAKFMKAKIDSTNESIKGGGMKADRVTEGSGYRNKRGFRKDVEEGKYKQEKDADYYKSIGLTGKRGDQAVDDFFKPYHMRSDAIKLKSGGMTKPMGYKSGTMVKARGCKLGRTRPTKLY